MFYNKFSFVLVVFSLLSIVWGESTVELTKDNLDSIEKDTWLVEYYSPNCSFCKRLAPIWDKLVETHGETLAKRRFFFGKVDCVANESICEKNDIDGYPTILLYNQGKLVEEFAEEHSYDAMLNYVNSKTEEYKLIEAKTEEPVSATPIKEMPLVTTNVLRTNPDGIVVPLTPGNFSSSINHGPWFVKFYAPWCGHCKALAPTWIQVGEALRGKINVAELDCQAYGDICTSEQIQSYPTIKFIQEGTVKLYEGARTVEALTSFAIGLTGSDIGQITTSNVQDIVQSDVAFVYLHDEQSPKAYTDDIYAISAQLGLQSKFYVTEDQAIVKALNVTEVPALIVFKNGESKVYTNKFEDINSLSKWIGNEKLPILIQLDTNTADEILNTPGYVVLGILNPGSPNFSQQRNILKEAAITRYRQPGNHKKARVVFAWVDGHKWLSYVYRVFGLNTNSFPSVVILKTWDDSYFDVDAEGNLLKLSSQQILETVKAAQNHELQEKSTVGVISRYLKRGGRGISLLLGLVWRSPLIAIFMFFVVIGGIFYTIFRCASDDDEEFKPDKAD